MAKTVKKTISLPADLAREAEALAETEGKTFSAVISGSAPARAHSPTQR